MRLALRGQEGAFQVCPTCGHKEGHIERGHAGHDAKLHCTACGNRISWLGKAHLDALAASILKRA
jgi:DNA-directed RNA polymerase subunit RPC12/RpoP